MKTIVRIMLSMLVVSVFTVTTIKTIKLKQNCTGYLKQAADASSVDVAKEQLGKSIKYLEDNNITSGYTSVLWRTPDEDIEFWYNNLKTSQAELIKVNDSTSSVSKTNLLMKLRETLLDNKEVTVPTGLARYPNNTLFGVLNVMTVLMVAGWYLKEYIDKANGVA
jgi:hypothetical protein